MLLVETYLNVSDGKGIGIFSKYIIPKGTTYWVRNEKFDRIFSVQELNSFTKISSDYIKNYGFLETSQNWYLCGDNARFSNHSDSSNTFHQFDEKGILQYCVASKEIKAGEEILCDYTELCQTCKNGVTFSVIK